MTQHSLEQVPWESCLLTPTRDDATESYAREKLGMPLPAIRYFAPLPWLSHAMIDLHPELGLLMSLELELNEMRENRLLYETYAAILQSHFRLLETAISEGR